MKINPDSPAFPRSSQGPAGDLDMTPGLTVRAYIASKALQGIMSGPNLPKGDARQIAKEMIEQSVGAADALIAELNKQP